MLVDHSDVALLRLTGFLKNLPAEQALFFSIRLLTPSVIQPLEEYGYLHLNRNGLSYSLTQAGQEFLKILGFSYPQDKRQPSHLQELNRRLEGARIMLTFYRAGMDVFSEKLSGLQIPFSYLHGAIIRRDFNTANAKLFAGCRFTGIVRIGDKALSVHYIIGGKMCYSTELRLLQNTTHPYGCHAGLMFTGGNYLEVARQLIMDPLAGDRVKNDSVTYREAYEKTTLPVHLLECSDVGAFQLRVMHLKDYRPQMTDLLLGPDHLPPDPEIPDSDGMISDGNIRRPFVAAMDMDLKRIDRAYRAARENGYEKIALGAFEPQAKALQLLYQVHGKAEVYSAAIPDLIKSLKLSGQRELAENLRLHEPERKAYITEEGGVLHVSAFPSHRKAGEPFRPEIWTVDGEKR